MTSVFVCAAGATTQVLYGACRMQAWSFCRAPGLYTPSSVLAAAQNIYTSQCCYIMWAECTAIVSHLKVDLLMLCCLCFWQVSWVQQQKQIQHSQHARLLDASIIAPVTLCTAFCCALAVVCLSMVCLCSLFFVPAYATLFLALRLTPGGQEALPLLLIANGDACALTSRCCCLQDCISSVSCV